MTKTMTHAQKRARDRRIELALQIITQVAALLPLALLFWDWWNWRLVDPIREATLRTGKPAIILLMLTLAITPLDILFGLKRLLPLRRTLGLYAFGYVTLHFILFVGVDYRLSWPLIRDGLLEKRFALAGLAAFLLLIPLAATSNKWAMRKLRKNWKRLHQLVYAIGVLALVHYFWLVKTGAYAQPILFTAILAVLLLVRVKPIRQRIVRWRLNLTRRQAQKGATPRPAASD